LGVAFVYPLSFGPACWITSRLNTGAGCIPSIYRPLALIMIDGPTDLTELLLSFSTFGAAPNWFWDFDPLKHELRWEPMTPVDCTVPMVPHIYPESRSKDELANSPAQNPEETSESN
jgi:hypothetical protein